jgi:hypothetical protein
MIAPIHTLLQPMITSGKYLDNPVILTPQIGDIDPPVGFGFKERFGVTKLQFFSLAFAF